MEVVAGQVVKSRRGRDVEKLYVVLGFSAGRVLLCDGDKWPLAAPKRKNVRHIQPTAAVLAQSQQAGNLQIKAALRAFAKSAGEKQGGKQFVEGRCY